MHQTIGTERMYPLFPVILISSYPNTESVSSVTETSFTDMIST